MTIEQAEKNLTIILEMDKLEMNKKGHLIAQESLNTLVNTAKEVEILRAKVAEQEILLNEKK